MHDLGCKPILGLPTSAGIGELLYESPRNVTATNGQFSDWIGPFEVHAYRFALTNWALLGTATPVAPGLNQFTDTTATNHPHRFYQLRSP